MHCVRGREVRIQWVKPVYTMQCGVLFFHAERDLLCMSSRSMIACVQTSLPHIRSGRSSNVSGSNTSDLCEGCASGKYAKSSGSSACTECEVGRYQPSNQSTSCLECPYNTYLNRTGRSSVNECVSCPFGSYTISTGAGSEDDCEVCSPGNSSLTL